MASSRGSSCSSSSIVKIGPWGGTRGSPWDDGGGYTAIRSITIQDLHRVEMISVEYDLFGQPVQRHKHGGPPVTPELTTQITLNFPDEFLTTIRGSYDSQCIRSLAFTTNQGRTFGSFRGSGYTSFSCSVDGGAGAIIGFFGRSSWMINSIGLYVAALCPANMFYDKMEEQGLVVLRTSPLCMPGPIKRA